MIGKNLLKQSNYNFIIFSNLFSQLKGFSYKNQQLIIVIVVKMYVHIIIFRYNKNPRD